MVELTGVTKSFGRHRAVNDVSLILFPGEPVVLGGPSGSGKTTLLRLIAGLETPDEGEIRIGGRLASGEEGDMPPHKRGVGVVFQEPALWPHMTVAENIGLAVSGASRSEREDRVNGLLEATGLRSLARRRPREISGGEAARAALARALAGRPSCLLMDEPLSRLDEDLKARQLDLILRSVVESAAALLYITHDSREAEAIGGRRVSIRGGRLTAATST